MDAANKTGGAIKRRDEVHRMAEANKALLNFVSNLIICSFFYFKLLYLMRRKFKFFFYNLIILIIN
jgi:hypothetical protein